MWLPEVGWMFTVQLDQVCVCVCVCVCRCVQVYANDTQVRPEFFIYDRTQIDWRQDRLHKVRLYNIIII